MHMSLAILCFTGCWHNLAQIWSVDLKSFQSVWGSKVSGRSIEATKTRFLRTKRHFTARVTLTLTVCTWCGPVRHGGLLPPRSMEAHKTSSEYS